MTNHLILRHRAIICAEYLCKIDYSFSLLMDALPYEILQLIASGLLPRYQCRFALTSRYHYRYLYSYLLKWHACKARIPVPIYKFIDMPFAAVTTLLCTDNKLVIYRARGNQKHKNITLYMTNYTTLKEARFYTYDPGSSARRDISLFTVSLYLDVKRLYKYFNKPVYRRQLHKKVLIAMVNIKSCTYTVDYKIKDRIMNLLDEKTKIVIKSCPHLYYMILTNTG